MSSRTPTECVELATDESASEDDRLDAIHALELANECDELEALVRSPTLEEQFRRKALRSLANPRCDATLRELVEEDPIDGPLGEEAADLLADLEDE